MPKSKIPTGKTPAKKAPKAKLPTKKKAKAAINSKSNPKIATKKKVKSAAKSRAKKAIISQDKKPNIFTILKNKICGTKKCKITIFISSIIIVFLSLFIYKAVILKYSVKYLEEEIGLEIADYNYQIALNPTIKITQISLQDSTYNYNFTTQNLLIKSDLFSNKFNIIVNDNIKVELEGQGIFLNLDPKSIIEAKLSGENLESLKIESSNIKTIDANNNVASEIRNLSYLYNVNNIDDKKIAEVNFTADNFSKFISDEMLESNINLSYQNIYNDIDEDDMIVEIKKLHIVNPKMSILLNGKYHLNDFIFDLEIENKEFLIDSMTNSFEKNINQLIDTDNEEFRSRFENKEELLKMVKSYKIKLVSFLDELSSKNELTTNNKDIFNIVSDPTHIVYINNIAGSEIFGMIQKYFTNEGE